MTKKFSKLFLAVCLLASIAFVGLSPGIAAAKQTKRIWPYTAGPGGVKLVSPVLPATSLPPLVRQLCAVSVSTGVYAGDGAGGGAFVEDWMTGNLVWCNSGVAKVIAIPPAGYSSIGYGGMGGVMYCSGALCKPQLVLVMLSWWTEGFYFCYGATPSGCGSSSPFIPLPIGFCTSMRYETCGPYAAALDRKLNLYYADSLNGVVAECYAPTYASCTVLEDLYPYVPIGIFLTANGNLWVSDFSCTGNVWLNGVVEYTVGDGLESITMSSANPSHALHVYVGDTGMCSESPAHVLDVTDGDSMPTPFGGPNEIPDVTPVLQFTSAFVGAVFVTQDRG